jgi:hypothetical protein
MVAIITFKYHVHYGKYRRDKMSKEDVTTIQLSKETRDRLRNLGKMGETYDDVINRLVQTAEAYTSGAKSKR